MGTLTPEEAESSPYRNVITRSIGTQPQVEPDVFVEEARAGDVWVLCSDGLTGHVQDEEIRHIASTQPPTEAARQLIELANSRGGRDNITVLVFAIRDLLSSATVAEPLPEGATAQENGAESAAVSRGIKRLFGK